MESFCGPKVQWIKTCVYTLKKNICVIWKQSAFGECAFDGEKESVKEDAGSLQIKLQALARPSGSESLARSYCFLLHE